MSLEALISIAPLRWSAIGTAVLCGCIVGLERQLRGKPIGMRTSALIVLGTYLFVASTMKLTSGNIDPSRIVGQVVTGIGFLGAGVMMSKGDTVLGVTSAASIWALAALGVCIAILGDGVSIKLSLVVVLILYGFDLVEDVALAVAQRLHLPRANGNGHGGRHRFD